jgi:outer membrane protein TolC
MYVTRSIVESRPVARWRRAGITSAIAVSALSAATGAGAQGTARVPVVIATAGTIAQPAQSPPLVLGDVYRELRQESPRLAAADALARAALARVPGAGLPPDPQLQLGWMNYELPSLKAMEPLGMVQLQVMQMLPLGGKLGFSRGIASSQASAQQQRASDVWWDSRTQAAMAFYDLYQADQALAVMRETLRLLEDIRKIAEAMYRVGEGRQTDVLRSQVEIARMTEDTLRMVAMRTGMAARLNALLDRGQEAVLASPALPAFPSEVPAFDSLQQLAYANRPMLRAGAQDLAAAEQMSKLARRELYPDLQVGVQFGQRGATMSGVDAAGQPMLERKTERMGSLMLGASVPIFARSRQLKLREEADAMRLMATADLAAMRADTRGKLGESYANLVRARRLSTLYRTTILPQAQTTVASAQSAYRVGQVDFMTLLDDQMTVNKYRQELYVLEADEGKAWAELEMLIGGELLDSNAVARERSAGGER